MQTAQTGSIALPADGRQLAGIVFRVAAAQAAGSFSESWQAKQQICELSDDHGDWVNR
jgi:hypothetical protein